MTTPLSLRRLQELAQLRLPVRLEAPGSSLVAALVLWEAHAFHLVKGAPPPPRGARWAVTWSKGYDTGRLVLVDTRWREAGHGDPLEPLDLTRKIEARPQPVLEGLALAVRHQRGGLVWKGANADRRRFDHPKLHPGHQTVTLSVEGRGVRSYRLRDLVAVSLVQAPTIAWDPADRDYRVAP